MLFLTNFCRLFGEALWQMSWQISAIMASGQSLSEQPVLAVSCMLSLAAMTLKGFSQGRQLVTIYQNPAFPSLWSCVSSSCLLAVLPATIILGMVSFFAIRLYMSQTCEGGSWNAAWPLEKGCVTFPDHLQYQ